MRTHATHVPVLVVGAGPTGMSVATLLARRGIETLIVERHHDMFALPRAVHLDDEVYRILQNLGVAEEFDSVSTPAKGMRLVDANLATLLELRRDGVGTHGWPQANMFDQPDLEFLLRKNLARYPAARLVSGTSVGELRRVRDGDRAIVEAVLTKRDSTERTVVTADFVLGCDGANSGVREFLDAKMANLHFEEPWLVVDVRCGQSLELWPGVHQVCDPVRPSTFMQIGPDRYRWEFRVNPGENVDELSSDASIQALLEPWFHDVPWGSAEVLRRVGYTFRAAVADDWGSDGVYLLGDAAHLTPPFIGQGLGAGLRDAANIAWKLAAVLDKTAHRSILDSYQQERKPHVTQVIRAAVAIGWIMAGGKGVVAEVRARILSTVCRIPGFSGPAMKSISPRLARGLSAARPVLRRHPVGLMVPQPRPFDDDRLGAGFALVFRGDVDGRVRKLAAALGASEVLVGEDDYGRALSSWMDRHRASAVLVRPDRVVADYSAVGTSRERGSDWAWPLIRR
ncbi:3-(3-hydroxy-phenyl)propionate hydroxylase [Rhodococcus sp. 27YEA15]|uniref:bifunctional 3-(3-hydroxy-phenyl)propionate/3-hydroxycinnamic acid hydroxylase MhpA n=1 Tax=Rhodococcus sp. 27YEA15 TaxID=3156259 RepID=UPI003C79ADD9